VEEALDIYFVLTQEYPHDIEAWVVLGNLYRLCGKMKWAKLLYHTAQTIDPTHKGIQNQLESMVLPIDPNQEEEELGEFSAVSVRRLSCLLLDLKTSETGASVRHAADIFEPGIPPCLSCAAENFSDHDLRQLLPALVDLNFRQALADNQTDLATVLRSLQIHLSVQKGDSQQ
jgi:hypothetical protein